MCVTVKLVLCARSKVVQSSQIAQLKTARNWTVHRIQSCMEVIVKATIKHFDAQMTIENYSTYHIYI